MKIRYHSQEPPHLGTYFKSERGRNAYHIVGIKRGRTGIGGMTVYNCEVEKVRAASLPADAEIEPFHWLPRGRRA